MRPYRAKTAYHKARRNGLKINLRLQEYQLAHALSLVQVLEPSYQMESTGKLVKLIFNDWIAKHSEFRNFEPTLEAKQEVRQMLSTTKPGIRFLASQEEEDLELAAIAAELKQSGLSLSPGPRPDNRRPDNRIPTVEELDRLIEQEKTAKQAERQGSTRQGSTEQATESIKSVVTDFSPPSMEELMALGGNEE